MYMLNSMQHVNFNVSGRWTFYSESELYAIILYLEPISLTWINLNPGMDK